MMARLRSVSASFSTTFCRSDEMSSFVFSASLEHTTAAFVLRRNQRLLIVGVVCYCYAASLMLLLFLSWRARQALPISGDRCPESGGIPHLFGTSVPKRWGIPPDSESGGIRLSLVIVDSHLLTGAPLKGGCRCPQLTYCRPLSNDRCWRMLTNCQAAVGSPTL